MAVLLPSPAATGLMSSLRASSMLHIILTPLLHGVNAVIVPAAKTVLLGPAMCLSSMDE